jgi:hypothetical protein
MQLLAVVEVEAVLVVIQLATVAQQVLAVAVEAQVLLLLVVL